ncbi:MAG: dihydrolipoyl dehydrogenase [Candidatus Bathyarchaeota archaeon]|nr:dihydrolipoyl dehydrogenase [Candidatus Bathyarchaeota archaeon]
MKKIIQTDVTIIGGGPGGYMAASRASQLGANVKLIEKDLIGGVCVNRGCIPTKTLIHIGQTLLDSSQLKNYNIGLDDSELDFSKMMQYAEKVAGEIRFQIEEMLRVSGVEVLKGTGRLVDNKTVLLTNNHNETLIETKKIIIATGASPWIPPITGSDNDGVFTSDSLFKNYRKPNRLIIIGAGPIGLEWATIFRSLGSEVTIIEMMPDILPREDEEVTLYLRNILEEQGINILTDTSVNEISRINNELILNLEDEEEVKGDLVLIATGRSPNTKELGLEKLVEMNRGSIIVDDHMRTTTENIYAVGDVVGKSMLAHVAMHEGRVAGENVTGRDVSIKYEIIPRCVFTYPEVAFIGYSEDEAEEEHDDVGTAQTPLRANGRALTLGQKNGFMKIIFNKKTRELLGAQIIAPHASELIGEMSLGLKLNVKVEDIIKTIHAHPTLSELIWEAVLRA